VAGILLILWSESNNSASFFGGIAGLLVSVFWGLQSAILTKHVRTVRERDRVAAARLEAVAKVDESSSDG
jgi:drug/metabolite transporter (DMT)-like permease